MTSTTMLTGKQDQTRLRMERMEADRRDRRLRTKEARVNRAEEERRNLSQGNPGDVDFIGLVRRWREEHAGSARPHDDDDDDDGPASTSSGDKICVCVRKRCLNAKEMLRTEHDAVTCLHPTATVHSARLRVDGISKYCDHNTFEFDHAFDEHSTTEDVYRHAAAPLVRYVCAGVGGVGQVVPRGTVFAYGQTGSGKTYTMGGIQRMVAEDVFSTLAGNGLDGDARGGCSLVDTTVSIAIFEIYGGRIQDLLNDRNRLKVLEDGRGEVVVTGLEEFAVAGIPIPRREGARQPHHARHRVQRRIVEVARNMPDPPSRQGHRQAEGEALPRRPGRERAGERHQVPRQAATDGELGHQHVPPRPEGVHTCDRRRVRARPVQAEQAHADTEGLLRQQVGEDGHDRDAQPR